MRELAAGFGRSLDQAVDAVVKTWRPIAACASLSAVVAAIASPFGIWSPPEGGNWDHVIWLALVVWIEWYGAAAAGLGARWSWAGYPANPYTWIRLIFGRTLTVTACFFLATFPIVVATAIQNLGLSSELETTVMFERHLLGDAVAGIALSALLTSFVLAIMTAAIVKDKGIFWTTRSLVSSLQSRTQAIRFGLASLTVCVVVSLLGILRLIVVSSVRDRPWMETTFGLIFLELESCTLSTASFIFSLFWASGFLARGAK